MAAAPPSRKEVAEWASQHCGHPVTQLERQCASGVIYCQLFDAVRPGVLDSSKVKFTAHLSQHETLSNYKVLQESFEKIGDLASLDVEKLARGQPQATLELLHKIYGLSTSESEAGRTKRGLSVLDVNAVAQQGQTKRTRSAAAKQMKRPTRAFLEAHNRLSSVPNAEQSSEPGGDAEATPSCDADCSAQMSTSERLHSALEHTHASLRQSQSEVLLRAGHNSFLLFFVYFVYAHVLGRAIALAIRLRHVASLLRSLRIILCC
eukprot:2381299-Pleurochrysis_carterae.AAC.1